MITTFTGSRICRKFGRERGLRYLDDYVNRSQDEIKSEADQELRRGVGKLSEDSYPHPDPEPYPELEVDWDEAFDRLMWDEYWDEFLKEYEINKLEKRYRQPLTH